MKAKRPSPRVRAIFRETAREIVGRDRDARRAKRTQNTIGEIERAMVNAFLLGQDLLLEHDAGRSPSSTLVLDWLEIPPRARNTLSSMTAEFCTLFSGRRPRSELPKPSEIEPVFEEGRKRWILVSGNSRSDRSIADGSVAPLIRLGLLSPCLDNTERYQLTEQGLIAGKDYWRRVSEDDPSLPRESLR